MLRIIVLILVFIGLRNNYKKDSKEHIKAKIWHAIIISVLLLYYSGSLNLIYLYLNDFDNVIDYISRDVGLFSGMIMQMVLILNGILSIYLLFLLYRLINRKKEDLARLKFILPIIAITESFGLYKVVVEKHVNNGSERDISLFFICLLIYGSLAFIIRKIYSKQIMIDFFNSKESQTN